MQSERRSSPQKNPYLSQYRNEISARQKLIRERLGLESATTSNNDLKLSTDDIPTIDDDDTAEQSFHERQFKGRLNYQQTKPISPVDLEAEESLRFFKKNLLPNYQSPDSGSSKPKAGDQPYTASNKQALSSRSTNPKQYSYSAKDPESIYKLSNPPKSPAHIKPVPFKQSSIQEPRIREIPPSIKELVSRKELPNQDIKPLRSGSSSSKYDTYKSPHDTISNFDRRKANGQTKNPSSEKDVTSNRAVQPTASSPSPLPKLADPVPMSTFGRESTRSADTPSQTGSFTRKPLYNSLLRAHDSIRLKVNRPKVRPKSEQPVEDTVVDDAIEPEPVARDSQASPNERAVDVKRSSSRRKSKKKAAVEEAETGEKVPIRNFSEVRIVKIVRAEDERSLGVTVRAEDGNIVVARIMAGSLADKQGALQVGDVILSVNNQEVYTPEQLQEQLRRNIRDDTVLMKIVPSFREELPTLCIYLRALFNYDANEDTLLPCKEVGVSFNQGDILEVVNQEDPNWWQARRVDSENLQTGLIPSQELEERRRAFVIPDYDLATRTSMCGTKVSRKSKKKEIYNVGQNSDFDKAELQLYEEVCRTPAFERRTLVLIGANGVGKQALKVRLITMDPDRFGTPLPHTSRLPREGEEDGVHYHFVSREKMEEDIINGKYLEYGEYDGALYGTKLDSVREIIGAGKVCVLDCSATCLKVLKTSDYLPFVAFIAAPTLDQLRYMHEWSRNGLRNYTTLDRALSRQSRRARTLQDFAFDFFEEEDLQLTVEESARLFRIYENHFDIVLVNNDFGRTFEQLRDAIDALSMAPQWIPISWIYGT